MAAPSVGTTRTNVASLSFPRDHKEDYVGRIRFTFVEVIPSNIDSTASFVAGLATAVDGAIADTTLQNPSVRNQIGGAAGRVGITGEQRNELPGGVTLYLPQSITFNDGMEYDNNVELGIIGGAIEKGISGGGSLAGAGRAAMEMAGSSISDITGAFTGSATSRVALSRLTRVGPQFSRDAISSGLRLSPNPNRRTLFRSVRPREFSFQFTMIANSPEEADDIDSIINRFRFEMYPDTVQGAGGEADFFAYEYPSMVDISLTYNDKQVATKIMRGYIVNMQTTYNPSSMGFHRDGKPSEVSLTMVFYEEAPLDRSMIARGY
jgi:hypothetical protein